MSDKFWDIIFYILVGFILFIVIVILYKYDYIKVQERTDREYVNDKTKVVCDTSVLLPDTIIYLGKYKYVLKEKCEGGK